MAQRGRAHQRLGTLTSVRTLVARRPVSFIISALRAEGDASRRPEYAVRDYCEHYQDQLRQRLRDYYKFFVLITRTFWRAQSRAKSITRTGTRCARDKRFVGTCCQSEGMTSASAPRRAQPAAGQARKDARLSARPARDPFEKLVDRQHGVFACEQAAAFGVSASTISYRVKPGGPWRRIFPGVYLADSRAPTTDQLDMAALLYAGGRSMLTGRAALRRYGIMPAYAGPLDVLVPATCSRADRGCVRIHRTLRLPSGAASQGPIRFTTIPRAVADAALAAATVRDMRAIVCIGVDRGRCTLEDLAAELGNSRLRNSTRLRAVIDDVGRGIRSGPEGDLMDLIDRSDLPVPLYNPRLYIGGAFLATPDAWWEAFGVAAEVDSREYHFEERDWENTMQRHARMTSAGIRVLHFTPRRIRVQPDHVLSTIRQTLQIRTPVVGLRTVASG